MTARTEGSFDDASLAPLEALSELRHLALFSCPSVTAQGMSALRKLTKLESLDLRNCSLTDAGVDCLLRSPLSEVRFNVVSTDFTAAGASGLAELPLKTLSLDCPHFDDECVEALESHSSLRDLSLSYAPIGIKGGHSLGTLDLRRLNLHGSSVGDAGIVELPKGLHTLDLGHCGTLTDTSCEAIAAMPDLEFLDMSSNKGISRVGLEFLSRLPKLKTLVLNFCALSTADVEPLRGHPSLQQLGLAFNNLDAGILDILEDIPTLTTIDLASATLTPESVDRLAAMPNTTLLGLYECPRETRNHARSFDSPSCYERDTLELDDGF